MKYIILTLGMISLISLSSCNSDELSNIETPKVDILDKNYIQKASMKEKLAYKKYYLKEALKEVTRMGFTSDDLIAISKDTKNQKDVVLFSDIIAYAKNEKKIIVTDPRVEKISNAFKELEGSSYDISFYIPFADKLNYSSKVVADDIYIFEQEDDSEQLAFEGSVLNEDGEYVTYEQLITEQMAEDFAERQGRKVVVVGLADVEAVNTGGNQGGTSTYVGHHFNMSNMIVKSHKESWISGASDLAINAERQINGYFYNAVSLHGGPESWTYLFRRVTRKEVRKKTNLYVNTSLTDSQRSTTPPAGSNYVIHYVIYELDMWPIGNRNVNFVHDGISHNVTYRSSDVPYDYKTLISNNGQIDYHTDNQDITYWASLSKQYK
ncbi:MAG: hypothetical protein KA796_04420 [Chryseobacterium sp.]|nr:hypothetical protein [Chryseobacterium sp.]